MSTPIRTGASDIAAKELPLFSLKRLVLVLASYAALYLTARWYEGTYAWSTGLDAFAPEFETYWMNLFYAEILVETIVAALLWGWLWRSRDRNLERYWAHFIDTETALSRAKGEALRELLWKTRDRDVVTLTPREELRRNMTHLIWLAAYAWAFYWGTSFFTEQDATWHQTVVRDTDFTPNHIIVFYMSYPVYIITGWGAFLYAKTRLPYFAKGFSVPYLFSVVGPFTLLPNVGYNEWGHTFWFMEEVFVAPLHYGFVVFAWFALSIGGVLLQVFASILYLIKKDLSPEPDSRPTPNG
ncbi:methane monooxygenase/ammonia monooxygenase subunit C [Methylocaldum gracile]|uniref:methane monooxygenase/ammonia monooxygenase subunit C n=1 Tax=Methylocaldum sp. 0917 TaxID=2485163 RepID=UPI0010E0A215